MVSQILKHIVTAAFQINVMSNLLQPFFLKIDKKTYKQTNFKYSVKKIFGKCRA